MFWAYGSSMFFCLPVKTNRAHGVSKAMHRWSQTVEELLHSAGCVERARSLRAEVVETCAICQDDLSLEASEELSSGGFGRCFRETARV